MLPTPAIQLQEPNHGGVFAVVSRSHSLTFGLMQLGMLSRVSPANSLPLTHIPSPSAPPRPTLSLFLSTHSLPPRDTDDDRPPHNAWYKQKDAATDDISHLDDGHGDSINLDSFLFYTIGHFIRRLQADIRDTLHTLDLGDTKRSTHLSVVPDRCCCCCWLFLVPSEGPPFNWAQEGGRMYLEIHTPCVCSLIGTRAI